MHTRRSFPRNGTEKKKTGYHVLGTAGQGQGCPVRRDAKDPTRARFGFFSFFNSRVP